MKVIKVIGSLDFGGIEKVFEITARYYEGDKKDIVFLCLGEGGAAEKAIREMGYRVVLWKSPVRIPRLGMILRLAAFFRSERPAVVHTTGAEANFHGIIAAWVARVPVRVAEEIGMPHHRKSARRVFRGVYRLSSRVVAVAGLVKDYLLNSREATEAQVEVIYNPVDVRAFDNADAKKADGVFRVISVCRLDPIKNLGLLIRGMASIKTAELWLVGDGPVRGELEALVREAGLTERVTFLGYQSNPASFLAQASLFVLPSFSEGIPLSVAEAMLSGTPCAVTRVGGAPEFILDGDNGWLLDPHDQLGFDRLLGTIMTMDDGLRRKIGSRGRDTALDKFRPDQYLRNVWDLYDRILYP